MPSSEKHVIRKVIFIGLIFQDDQFTLKNQKTLHLTKITAIITIINNNNNNKLLQYKIHYDSISHYHINSYDLVTIDIVQTYNLNRCGNFKVIYHLRQEHLKERKQRINNKIIMENNPLIVFERYQIHSESLTRALKIM